MASVLAKCAPQGPGGPTTAIQRCVPGNKNLVAPVGPHELPPRAYLGVWMGDDGSPMHICAKGTLSITFVSDGHVTHSGVLHGWSDPPQACTVKGPPVLFGVLPSEHFVFQLDSKAKILYVNGVKYKKIGEAAPEDEELPIQDPNLRQPKDLKKSLKRASSNGKMHSFFDRLPRPGKKKSERQAPA